MLRQDRVLEAIANFEQALALAPHRQEMWKASVWAHNGRALMRLGRYERAIGQLRYKYMRDRHLRQTGNAFQSEEAGVRASTADHAVYNAILNHAGRCCDDFPLAIASLDSGLIPSLLKGNAPVQRYTVFYI